MTRPYSEESAQAHKLIGDPNHGELARHLDTVGDGSGSKAVNVAASTVFRLKPPSGTIFVIDEIRIVAWDNVITNGDKFCGIAALGTGCLLEIREKPGDSNEHVVQDLTDGVPITKNGDLAALGDLSIFNDGGGPASMIQCSIKPGAPYRIEGAKGESLVFATQSDLSGLNGMYVLAKGRIYTNGGF